MKKILSYNGRNTVSNSHLGPVVQIIVWLMRPSVRNLKSSGAHKMPSTVQILCIGTDRSDQTVQTKIRLLLKKQSDQGLHCLPFHPHLLDALMQCYVKLFYF